MTLSLGCYECSQRRVSCDNLHPVCGKCRSRGITCSGFGTRYRFRHNGTLTGQEGKVGKDNVSPCMTKSASSIQACHSKLMSLADLETRSPSGLDCHILSFLPCHQMQGARGSPNYGMIQHDSLNPGPNLETCHVMVHCAGSKMSELFTGYALSESPLRLPALGYLDAWKEVMLNHCESKTPVSSPYL